MNETKSDTEEDITEFDKIFKQIAGINYPPRDEGGWTAALLRVGFDQQGVNNFLCDLGYPEYEKYGGLPGSLRSSPLGQEPLLRLRIWEYMKRLVPENDHHDAGKPGVPLIVHDKDFQDVTWRGKQYIFAPLQGQAVKYLWEAFDSGSPEKHQNDILDAIHSQQLRLYKLFQSGKHPAWKTMIIPGTAQGTFCLS